MRVQALLVPAVLMLCALGCSEPGGSLKQPAAREDSIPEDGTSVDSTYDALVQQGETSLAAGQLTAAREAFEAAAAVHLFEVPNYEVLVRIADVKCREGDVAGARSILKDFRCMLAVDSGRIPCLIEDNRLNPDLSDECAKRMCGEMYTPYYEAPTESQLKAVEELTREADRVERMCSRSSR